MPSDSTHLTPLQHWGPLALGVAALLAAGVALAVSVTTRSATQQSVGTGSTATCPAAEVAAKTMPSVVTLYVKSRTGSGSNGSGQFLDTEGHILTNNHVISSAVGGGAVIVVRPNGEELPATLVGRDPKTDLAVVKVDPKEPAQPVRFGSTPPIGAQVFAIGAPLGLTETFTSGVVSGLGRSVRVPSDNDTTALLVSAIQTDASINPGNSGGMLADCSGDLVGVPTAGATASDSLGQPVAGSIGLGFAVPAPTAKRVADSLISDGKIVHGDFGLSVVPVLGPNSTLTPSGLYITGVTADGPAARANLRRSDIITALAGQPVTSADQLQEASLSNPPGTTVTIQYVRDNQSMTTDIIMG
ncbi:S1C family serine protease [Microlunatus phosphovorus]|nr:trypsin-like peptidase domain-containing protein [Microlunatus phosphovorus]